MADLLTLHAFEIESVEKFKDDFVLDIKILPNRAHDCMSHIGVARELAAISGSKFLPPKMKFSEDKKLKAKNFISVEVPAKDLCPRYSMRVATDIKMGVSPKWMQERLSACGLRPISNIVDITNYVMLETGQPLHAFDVDKVGGQKIIVRRASEGEKITTLEGKSYNLSPQNLVIADEKVAIGIAGIKGGEGPEIDEHTKTVAIESANFEPTNIRRTSKAFVLRTDASTRFENGLDPELTAVALERSVALIEEFAGGRVAAGLVDIYPDKVKPRKILADVDWMNGLIGLPIKVQEMIDILARFEILAKTIKKGGKTLIEADVPTNRLDLVAQEDLAEEIARAIGYDKIPTLTPHGIIIPAVKDESLVYEDKIKDILVGAGWTEAQNYSFISDDDIKAFKITNQVQIKNPFSQDQKYLRPTLIVNLLKNVKENLKYFDRVRLFELGHVFSKAVKDFGEDNKIAATVSAKNTKKPAEGFFELKGLIQILFDKLGIDDVWFDDEISGKLTWFDFVHPSRRAQVKSGDIIVGWVGEVKQDILDAMEIKEKTSIFELDFPILVQLASEERTYRPPSKYPAIMRDLAVVVPQTTKTETVLNVIEIAGGELLQDTDLFDIYEGLPGDPLRPRSEASKKSLAFRLTFQSDERNLTDEEVNKQLEKVIKAIEEEEWEVRK
jgi:phenylalanyl-tRNA synthetase beta chain